MSQPALDPRRAPTRCWFIALVLLGAESVVAQAQASPDAIAALLARIERFDAAFDQANRMSGVLLIARGETILLQHAFDRVDAAANSPAETETPCPIASITKIFTLVATQQMVREGKLSLDDRLGRWLPDFPDADRITLQMLLRHQSGIPHRVATAEQEKAHQTAADVASAAARQPLVFVPGSRSSYSTAGYGVLARALELADGRPFHEILARRVFAPVGMKASFDATDPMPHAARAAYLPLDGQLVPAPQRDLSYLAGGGSSVSTAGDLYRFVRALQTEGIDGVHMTSLAPDAAARWTGASNGYFSSVSVTPEDDLTVIWVGNTWGSAATAIWPLLPAIVRGDSPAPPVVPARTEDPPLEALAPLAGAYRVRPGAFAVVALDGKHLRLDDNYLVPIGPDSFWVPGQVQPVRFIRDASDSVVALERGESERVTRMERVPQGEQAPTKGTGF